MCGFFAQWIETHGGNLTNYDPGLVICQRLAPRVPERCSNTRRDTQWSPGAARNTSVAREAHDDEFATLRRSTLVSEQDTAVASFHHGKTI